MRSFIKISISVFLLCYYYNNVAVARPDIKPSFSYETLDTTKLAHKKLWEAQLYITQSNPDRGIPILLSLIDTADVDSGFITFCKIYLAEAYRQKHEQQIGINILYQLLKQKNISKKNKALTYNRIAALYAAMNNETGLSKDDSVFKYSNLCLRIAEANNYQDLLASSENELGQYYFNVGKNNDLALEYCTKAYDTFMELEMYQNACYVTLNISSIYLSMNKPEKAFYFLSSVENKLIPSENKNLFMYIYEKKAEISSQLKRYKEAYENITKACFYEKAFFDDKLDRQVAEMTAKYDLQEKEKILNEKIHEARMKQQQNRFLVTTVIFILILMILVSVAFYFKKKLISSENQMLKARLENKNKELVSTIAHIVNMNKTFGDIKIALNNNDKEKVMSLINQNVQLDKNWNSFLQSFESIYPFFFETLKEKFPELTKSELRLSALLLIGHTTGEIADILNISPASVSKNRNRLRKKFNLPPGYDLKIFLQDISKTKS